MMGLRAAAVLTAVVVAIVVIAAFLVTHRNPVGGVPAGQDPNVKAYQAMVNADYNIMSASTSNHCGTIDDTGCAQAISAIVPTLQKWVNDLSSFKTPARFVAIDGQIRRHLTEVVSELNAAVAFQKAHNTSGFDLAMGAAVYERAWIDPATFSIEGSYPPVASSYRGALLLARQGLDACVNGTPGPSDLACNRLSQQQSCTGATAQSCESDVQGAETRAQTFLIGLLENPSPASSATANGQFENDLAQADTALLAITDALLRGDSLKVNAGQVAYSSAIVQADSDGGAIRA